MKIALAFWGLTRSLKHTINSIRENILNVLNKNNIKYHIFMHTYKLNTLYTNTRSREFNIHLNNNEYILLKPHFIKIDDQDIVKKNLNLKKYRTHPDPWDSNYKTVDNFILSLYSKKMVTKMIEYKQSTEKYDYIIFLRPDVKYLNKFKIFFLNSINNNTVCIPNFALFHNFNDRFFLSNYSNAILYGKLFDKLLEYSKEHKLHSETFMSNFIRKIYKLNVHLIPFFFNRVRANGLILNDEKT
jgi:hypothetical protein